MKPAPLSLALAAALGGGWLLAQEPNSKPEEPRAAADSPLPAAPPETRVGPSSPPPRVDRPSRRDGFGPGDGEWRPGPGGPGGPGGPFGPPPPRRGGGPEGRPYPPEGGRPYREGGPEGLPGGRSGQYGNPNVPLKPQPYLGVVTRPSPTELNLQLKHPEGFGLIVDDVLEDSPAKQAGLRHGDLLRLLDDQWLVNPGQLEALVRRAGKDKEVMLTLLREGSEQKIAVKIGEKLLPARRPLPPPTGFLEGPRDPQNLRDSDRAGANPGQRAGSESSDRQTRYAPERARVLRKDDSGQYEIQRIDGSRIFTARKRDGEVHWKGPVDTEEERRAMPEELRRKFQEMEQSRPLERFDEREHPDARPAPPNDRAESPRGKPRLETGSPIPGDRQR